MIVKSVKAQIKKIGPEDGLEAGQFEALVSVFGNKDSYGDVVMPGAFEETLKSWTESGDPIPIYYSHRMDEPDFNIGYGLDAKELAPAGDTPGGLWVKGQLDLEDGSTSKAKQVHRLMKRGTLKQFSFAYDVIEGGWAKRKIAGTDVDEEYFELRKLALYEVGPTPIGANQETALLGVKHVSDVLVAGMKAGRVLSAKNESSLREARDAIDKVLSSLGAEDETKHAQPDQRAKPEEPPVEVKGEEPVANRSAARLALLRMYDSTKED